MSERVTGAVYVALSASGFGAMAIFAKFAYQAGADVVAIGLLRFALAAALMTGLMLVRPRRWPRGRNLALLALMGGVGYVAQSYSFFSALNYASAALVALLLYLHPCMVTVAGALLMGQRLTRVRIACVSAALVGTALIIGADVSGQPAGIALGVLAAVIYAAYLLVGSRVLASEDTLAAASVVMLSAAAGYALVALIEAPAFPQSIGGWVAVGSIAVLSTSVAMVLLFAGIKRLGAADAATLSTLEPLVTAVLAAFLLGEQITLLQGLGGAIILLAGIALVRFGERDANDAAQ